MQIGTESVRAILERPLSATEIEALLRGLDDSGKAQLFARIADMARRASAVADIANRVSDSLSLDVLFPRLMEMMSDALNAERSSLFLYDPETGELRNMWTPTAQPGLWFAGGSFVHSRIYAKYVALQIKAEEEKLCSV